MGYYLLSKLFWFSNKCFFCFIKFEANAREVDFVISCIWSLYLGNWGESYTEDVERLPSNEDLRGFDHYYWFSKHFSLILLFESIVTYRVGRDLAVQSVHRVIETENVVVEALLEVEIARDDPEVEIEKDVKVVSIEDVHVIANTKTKIWDRSLMADKIDFKLNPLMSQIFITVFTSFTLFSFNSLSIIHYIFSFGINYSIFQCFTSF
jgi:hypothetical protein